MGAEKEVSRRVESLLDFCGEEQAYILDRIVTGDEIVTDDEMFIILWLSRSKTRYSGIKRVYRPRIN